MLRATVTPPREMFFGECCLPSLGQHACRALCRQGQRAGVRREANIGFVHGHAHIRLHEHPTALYTGQVGGSTLSGLIGTVLPLQVLTLMPLAQAPWPCLTKQRHIATPVIIAHPCCYCKAPVVIAKTLLLLQVVLGENHWFFCVHTQ